MIMNVNRINVFWGISDFKVSVILIMFTQAITISMRMLPILTLMMHTVPKGIEGSMYALITASITISVNWGGDLMGSIV